MSTSNLLIFQVALFDPKTQKTPCDSSIQIKVGPVLVVRRILSLIKLGWESLKNYEILFTLTFENLPFAGCWGIKVAATEAGSGKRGGDWPLWEDPGCQKWHGREAYEMAATEVEAGEGGGPVVRLTAPDEEEEEVTIVIITIAIIQVPFKPCGCRHPCGCEKPCTFTELKVSFHISSSLLNILYKLKAVLLFMSSWLFLDYQVIIPTCYNELMIHMNWSQSSSSKLFFLMSAPECIFCKI